MRQSRSSSKAGGGASKVRKMSELSQPGVDVAKRAGRVGFGSGQSGLRVNRVSGRVGLTHIFQTFFFFFFFQLQKD